MRARTIAYIVAALTPFWLLAILAIHGRFFVSPYDEIEYGPEATKKILSYSMVLRYTDLYSAELETLNPEVIDKVSERWMRHYREAILDDIPPVSPEDDGTYGFRGEIETSRRQIIIALSRDLTKQVKNENYAQASTRIAQLMETANVAKYNSTYASFFASTAQLYALDQFESIESKLTPDQKTQIFRALERAETNPEVIKHNAEKLSIVSSRNPTTDSVKFPSKNEITMILTSSRRSIEMSACSDTQGILLAESYRVAYQQELQLAEKLSRYRITALKTN